MVIKRGSLRTLPIAVTTIKSLLKFAFSRLHQIHALHGEIYGRDAPYFNGKPGLTAHCGVGQKANYLSTLMIRETGNPTMADPSTTLLPKSTGKGRLCKGKLQSPEEELHTESQTSPLPLPRRIKEWDIDNEDTIDSGK